MSRIAMPTRSDAPADSQVALDALDAQLGFVPNSILMMSLSPPVLMAFCALRTHIRRAMDGRMRGRIALAVAQANNCPYSISAHSYLAHRFYELEPEEMAMNRMGHSRDDKADVIVSFVQKVITRRGQVADEDLAIVRAGGFSDPEIIEMLGIAAYYSFANIINNVAQTDIDFPVVTTDPGELN
jgi:uncharacterized peroxidase-related enzyme